MLVRTIKLIAPNADYSTEGAPSFTDQADISGWALNDCLYIAKLGIIKGSDGIHAPCCDAGPSRSGLRQHIPGAGPCHERANS